MSLYRRKDSTNWWIKLSHNGSPIQKSTGTPDRLKALEYHDKLKAQLWDLSRLGVKPSHTWKEAVVRWLDEKSHKASINDDIRNFRWLRAHLDGMSLERIDRDCVDRITQARRRTGVSNGTVNRMLSLMRSVLRTAAYDWEWVERAPKVRLLPEARGRTRYLTPVEARRLLAELPEHLAAMAQFAMLTGLRQRNVRELSWAEVDLDRRLVWVHADQAKGGKGIASPLTVEAVAVVRSQVGKHDRYVFTYRSQPIRWVNNTAWKGALKRAGIENFRWHDLRHTWATFHMQAGTPLHVVQQLGGWSSSQMTQRYAHLSPELLSGHVASFGDHVKLCVYDPATAHEVQVTRRGTT